MASRLDKLKELEATLYKSIQYADYKELPALSRQYRDTLREIEEIEGGEDDDDEIAELLKAREANGKAGAVRPSRT